MKITESGLRKIIKEEYQSVKLPEDKFWQIVSTLGWGTETTDYELVKERILKSGLTPDEIDGFGMTHKDLHNRLYVVISDWEEDKYQQSTVRGGKPFEGIGLGDDGFGDLINHIIGLGKEEYYSVTENPRLAKVRANKYDFAESFAFAIPHVEEAEEREELERTPSEQELYDHLISYGADSGETLESFHEALIEDGVLSEDDEQGYYNLESAFQRYENEGQN